MLRIDQINDLETLRQVATILEKENERLHARLAELTKKLATFEGKEGRDQLELELVKLQEQLAAMQHRLFGRSSEKRPKGAEEGQKDRETQKGHGPRAQTQLPIEEVVVPHEEGLECPYCKGLVEAWEGQYEESEQITVVKRSFVLQKIKRAKGKCSCGATVVTAAPPAKAVSGGRYSLSFAVEVATGKYLDHLPLEREVRMMRRAGLEVDSQTLWDQLWGLYQHLRPTYEALRRRIFASPVIHADETRWRMLSKPPSTWQMWAVAMPRAVYYDIQPSRSAEAARGLLDGYVGTVMVDGYDTYKAVARERGAAAKIVLAFCWAHVRRKYVEASRAYPEETEKILELIGEMYEVERSVPSIETLEAEEAREEALAQLAKLRDEKSRDIVEQIKTWAGEQRVTPGSALREAIQYMLNHWDGLKLFLDDPKIPLDNNLVERALRGPVVGRKNHYGSKSERGTRVAALFYSLLETAKLCNVNPEAYLLEASRAAIANPGTVTFPGQPPMLVSSDEDLATQPAPAGQLALPRL